MKTKFACVLLYLLIFPSINSIELSLLAPSNAMLAYPQLSMPGYGVSNYNISQSVTYEVIANFTLTHKSGPNFYCFKFTRLNNRMPNSSLTRFCPPYQESKLHYTNITGYFSDEINIGHHDRFNNTYDSFNASLSVDNSVSFDQAYTITLNEINFQDIDETKIGEYDYFDDMFTLYCNYSEQFYETNASSLISLSNSIVLPNDTVVEKAEKVYNWVSNYLVYDRTLDEEKGALWAYNQQRGDCSEYSSLMITLLRIQGIPARKVVGFLISNYASTRPKVGDTWNFYDNNLGSNFLGHAWMEYYVPEIGWIACDPTWHEVTNYFNRIDFLRFNWNVGANIFFPPNYTISEFGNPIIACSKFTSYEHNYNIKITVLESNLALLSPFPLFVIIFITIGVGAVVIVIFLIIRKGRKKEISYGY